MAETLKQYKKRVASSGGRAIVSKYGRKYMKKLSKKGLDKRYNKKSNPLKKLLFD